MVTSLRSLSDSLTPDPNSLSPLALLTTQCAPTFVASIMLYYTFYHIFSPALNDKFLRAGGVSNSHPAPKHSFKHTFVVHKDLFNE